MSRQIAKGILIFPIIKDLNQADGIVYKNEGIRKGFLNNGINADTLLFFSNGIYLNDQQLYAFSSNRWLRLFQYYFTCWSTILTLVRTNGYDFVWLRVPLISYAVCHFIRQSSKVPHCRVILEYGTYPFYKELSGFRKVIYLLNKPFEKLAHRKASFIINYTTDKTVDGRPNIPVNNGVDIDEIPNITNAITLSAEENINLICVSSLKTWHAYERLLEGFNVYLQEHKKLPLHFHIVGDGPELEKLKSIVKNYQLTGFVTFHGFKTGTDLNEIYKICHVAIGTLGLHRLDIVNSSSLKTREYLARALPVVLSTNDVDIPANLPFVHYIESGEDYVKVFEIIDFAQKVYQIPDLQLKTRSFAEEKLSWTGKIREVIQYLNKNW